MSSKCVPGLTWTMTLPRALTFCCGPWSILNVAPGVDRTVKKPTVSTTGAPELDAVIENSMVAWLLALIVTDVGGTSVNPIFANRMECVPGSNGSFRSEEHTSEL